MFLETFFLSDVAEIFDEFSLFFFLIVETRSKVQLCIDVKNFIPEDLSILVEYNGNFSQ